MPEEHAHLNVSHMAKILGLRRQQGRDTVLVLGSRAGGLYRNREFYETLKLFGDPSFSSLPRIKQFGQCYRILTRRKNVFDLSDIDGILTHALKELDITDADIRLAELVKSGLFGIIVTTNIDTILEESLKSLKMQEMHDFEVFRLYDGANRNQFHFEKNIPCKIIKVFGELHTQYSARRGGYLNRNPSIKAMLEDFLEQDVMIIGLDPVWDEEIHQAFRLQGKSFWFINEEEPEEYTLLSQIEDARNARYFLGPSADYTHFTRLLYSTITRQTQLASQESETASLQQQSEGGLDPSNAADKSATALQLTDPSYLSRLSRRTLEIFISYDTRDDSLLNELLLHVASLKYEKIIHEWHNHKIQAGQIRADEVDSHLKSADIILLLVSSGFTASDYIYSGELTQAMKLHNAGKARVIPIILRPVDWKGMPFGGLEPLPTDGKAVTTWDDRDRAWLDIVQGIREVAKELWKIV